LEVADGCVAAVLADADAIDAASTMAAATIGNLWWTKLIRYVSAFRFFEAGLANCLYCDAATIFSQTAI
jgi:hypothetical protein